jgi:hypothetical protein
MKSETTPVSTALAPASHFFHLGAELLTEVQKIVGSNRVRSLRIKLGSRTIKEIKVAPLTAVATIALVLLAVIISTMTIEVEQEPASSPA